MKKVILSILLLLLVIIIIVVVKISDKGIVQTATKQFNARFEAYKDKTIYGADILSIINKAIDNNRIQNIPKDEEGNYIENDTSSIKVDITLLSTDEDNNVIEVTYPMERLQQVGLEGFIQNFSLVEFKCTEIEYNKQKRVSKIKVKQLEI
ncbi:MAG: hypothetical protein HFJ52_01175 [Clostridia bacterium]|nr:hypothetical protein [Clostridia bacterium]